MNFAQHVINEVNPGNRFLEEMTKVVPWEMLKKELEKGIIRKKGGRPAYCLLLLLKIHLLQVWYGLSDAGCEYQIKDRLSFREFLGLGINDAVPVPTKTRTRIAIWMRITDTRGLVTPPLSTVM